MVPFKTQIKIFSLKVLPVIPAYIFYPHESRGYALIENYFSQTLLNNVLPEWKTLSIVHTNKPTTIRSLSSILSTIRFRKHVSLSGRAMDGEILLAEP